MVWQSGQGRAWQGLARLGEARHGLAVGVRHGTAWRDEAWFGSHGGARLGWARLGWARPVMVWQSRQGLAWPGAAGPGEAWFGSHGKARRGEAGRGEAWFGSQNTQTERGKIEMHTMTVERYTVPPQTGLTDEDAEVIGGALSEMMDRGPVTVEDVVQEAESAQSALHPYFEWDDQKAAKKYRVNQAYSMLRCIQVVVKEQVKPVRAFNIVSQVYTMVSEDNVKTTRIERGYLPITVIVKDAALIDQVVGEARRELESWRDRYRQYQELSTTIVVIDQVIDQLKEAA